jgi:hypothetical protein
VEGSLCHKHIEPTMAVSFGILPQFVQKIATNLYSVFKKVQKLRQLKLCGHNQLLKVSM